LPHAGSQSGGFRCYTFRSPGLTPPRLSINSCFGAAGLDAKSNLVFGSAYRNGLIYPSKPGSIRLFRIWPTLIASGLSMPLGPFRRGAGPPPPPPVRVRSHKTCCPPGGTGIFAPDRAFGRNLRHGSFRTSEFQSDVLGLSRAVGTHCTNPLNNLAEANSFPVCFFCLPHASIQLPTRTGGSGRHGHYRFANQFASGPILFSPGSRTSNQFPPLFQEDPRNGVLRF